MSAQERESIIEVTDSIKIGKNMPDSSESGCDDGPHRVWSLWDIMNRFEACPLIENMQMLATQHMYLVVASAKQGGGDINKARESAVKLAERSKALCAFAGLGSGSISISSDLTEGEGDAEPWRMLRRYGTMAGWWLSQASTFSNWQNAYGDFAW